jgi:hypothetical protein
MTFGSGHFEAGPDHRIAGIRPCWLSEFGCLTRVNLDFTASACFWNFYLIDFMERVTGLEPA